MGIGRVQGVFGVDKGRRAAGLLNLSHHMQGQGGLARTFRAIDFNDAALGQTANAKRQVKAQGTRGHRLDLHGGLVAQLHYRALAEGPVNL